MTKLTITITDAGTNVTASELLKELASIIKDASNSELNQANNKWIGAIGNYTLFTVTA